MEQSTDEPDEAEARVLTRPAAASMPAWHRELLGSVVGTRRAGAPA